jgi:DNA-binding XRE family transcriptional regulator
MTKPKPRMDRALAVLRKRCAMTQEQLAVKLAVGRSAVCKLERRADMHVSKLRRYIEALGGTLEITARFPDRAVAIAEVGELVAAGMPVGRRPPTGA